MTIKSRYPASRPALGLDFAKTKRLDPRVTFTRASTGTFVGADGLIKTAASGVARFDHNPTTGESLGLLVEEARTNLRTNSENVSSWLQVAGYTNTTAINVIAAPDGAITADNRYGNSGQVTGANLLETNATVASGQSIVMSVYAKYVPSSKYQWISLNLSISGGTSERVVFNLQTGAGTFTNAISGYSQILPNGWFRFIAIHTNSSGSSQTWGANTCRVFAVDASNADVAVGSGTGSAVDGVYLWGGQVEVGGSLPSSYIPTSGATVTRAAEVATLSNANSSVFPTSAFTTVNTPFGTAGGGSTVKLVGPTVKRTAIYAGDLTQAQINALAGVNDNFWRWRVLGSSFALPNFTTDGSVTVDWGDGTVQTLTTAVRTFANGGGYHDIGFRLNSGTFFKPNINQNATYKDRVIAVGPAPASMKVDGSSIFYGCTALRGMDGYVDFSPTTNLGLAWISCSSLVEFPLVNTSSTTNMNNTWRDCSGLTSFPLINTSLVTTFSETWRGCSGLTSFPLINTGSATNMASAWNNNVNLTSFPLINTANVTNFGSTWFNNNKLTSFPLINTAAGTTFYETWFTCSSLTSFPLINTGAGTTFERAWGGCTGLTSFPLINTGAGTNFLQTWLNCANLTSFPSISFAAATNLQNAWFGCSKLATFPANMFNTTGTLVSNAFFFAFVDCALTAASIENILTSLVTNGQSNIQLGLNGGTNAGAATWTTAANTAYATLISRGWTITRNP